MRCAIWYHLHNLKNVKNTHGGLLILVKLQAEATSVEVGNYRTNIGKKAVESVYFNKSAHKIMNCY